MKLWIARSVIETLQNGSADPINRPPETRTRKLRVKKNILVPLNHQQKTTPPLINTRKVVSTTGKTTAKVPGF